MTHPILDLQAALVAALAADSALTALIGAGSVFDAPPKGRKAPQVVVVRHDLFPRDGDAAPGHEHRVLIQCWSDQPSRKAVLAIAERVLALAMASDLDGADLIVTHRRHERTDTEIDGETGVAKAALALRFFSEPVA